MFKKFLDEILVALRMTGLTLLLTVVLYPAAVTLLAGLLLPGPAGGSLLRDEQGRVVGSLLIAQRFTGAGYFHPRPSAAGAAGYDAAFSGGSNLGPTSRALRERVAAAAARLLRENPLATPPVPLELVTTSASGLDPHLSPAAVRWQLPRVAAARRVEPARLARLVVDAVTGPDLGLLGEPRVDVLALNLALDRLLGRAHP